MKRSFKLRILVSMIAVVVIIFTFFSLFVYKSINDAVTAEQNEQDEILVSAVGNHIGTILNQTEISVQTIANNEEIKRLFYERDRDGLVEYLVPVYASISDKVSQFQFHLPDATSFLRLHNVGKYGDSLADIRYTVVEANKDKRVVTGIEEGVYGYGLRVVIPMEYNNIHIGTVEFGNDFGIEFLSELKDKFQGEFSIYTFDSSVPERVKLLVSTTENEALKDYSSYEDSLKHGNYQRKITDEKDIYILMIPFADYNGDINGFITRTSDYTRVRDNNISIRNTLIFIAVLALIVIISLIYAMLVLNLKPLAKINEATMRISEGDLRVHVDVKNEDELGMIANSFNLMISKVRDVLTNIHKTSNEVASSSELVSNSSSTLSEGAMDQASAIEELTASMTLIAAQTKLNADNAEKASEMTTKAQSLANDGNQKMQSMVSAMNAINDSSNNISKVVKVIDDIAFQTNILALNAAVEAARAGVHGKGFAVVAEEVRNLASKSSQAVKETSSMIENSIVKVNEGTKIASETAEGLNMIVDEVSQIKDLVGEIAVASKEQSFSVEQINQGINQISEVVQKTSNTARETADSSEILSKQANILNSQVNVFTVE
ncbi:MAG: HAMP domain-containing protein [Clostridia bacterium]|nr:HAMP domain-containing protein [Clostridia bacterium]